jgi:versiconal hemiacetal acetate esterase
VASLQTKCTGLPDIFGLARFPLDFESPRHLVGLADDLSKFPPCYIVNAEKDCFRDDGKVLDFRLRESGVRSKLDYYEGLPHYFHAFPQLAVAHEMMDKAVEGARFVLQ